MVLLLLICGEILVLTDGRQIGCDSYSRDGGMVVLTRGEIRYSLREASVDWPSTRAMAEHPPPPPRSIEKEEPEPDRGVVDDFIVAKLDVRRASRIDLIRFLADMRDINLYIDPSVEDRPVTYRFRNLPWIAVMEIVCRDAGAAMSLNGRMLSVGDR